ncbi:NO-inducible flavohemoprotein [Francisella frigiditurris]|uniref:nitric oxide dioxygenase n=1 Tax=Francisella frigiditurris TaxID=1542390 RepID=A0A1J0KWI1_9GAMM|nr:NO-inducible flavohemoprotein [Francisella frigiditurris]APC97988.1 FAD-binding domain protein [Francisella frigiditurris]
MLSQNTIDIIKTTIPILEENGIALTKYFYHRMFVNNPEIKKFFNQAHQENNSQQEALAVAILAYAKNIDNLDALGSAIELISQKHASLQIKPEHYPIVGNNLIESIKEVLNLDSSSNIILAWEDAYRFLANILIGREKKLYDENLEKYGWDGFENFKIIKKEHESSTACSFYLKNDRFKKINFKPGQYVTVRFPYQDTTTMRNYSISSATGEDYLRITVKKETKGSISNYLHNEIKEHDNVEVSTPYGEFFLDLNQTNNKPIVLISAGIGITPLMSMLLSELKTNNRREILFICGKKNKAEHSFAEILKNLAKENSRLKTIFFYENGESKTAKQGLIDLAVVKDMLGTNDAQYFFCGPKNFMLSIQERLLNNGVNSNDIHFEFFGSKNV